MRRFGSWPALSAIALLGALLRAPPPAVGEDLPTPKVRHRAKEWGFSVLMFKEWPPVPLRAEGSARRDDLLETLRVLRFFERGEADRFVDFKSPAVAEAYAAGRRPSAPDAEFVPGGQAVDMRKVLVSAARRYGFGEFTLDPKAGKRVNTKDGVRGSMWRVETDGHSGLFAVWEKDHMQVGLWIGGKYVHGDTYDLGFNRVIHSVLWTDDQSRADPLEVLAEVNLAPERREALERSMVRGWDVVVSPKKQYVVVFNTKGGRNAKLARLIAERIEAIRGQLYERDFPPAQPFDDVAVVRVCGDVLEYHYYGGPAGSAGYWNDRSQELVFYDASPKRAVDENTLSVLYHEAFHQYIHYASGRLAPHPWFNEGHGDYYAGAKFERGTFRIEPFVWRVGTIRDAIARGTVKEEPKGGYVPLDTLVQLNQRQYYAYPAICYAEGWSLVYFLRSVVPTRPDWQAKWGGILDRYFRTLKEELAKAKTAAPAPPVPPAPGGASPPTPAPERPPAGPPPPADGADPGIPMVLRDLLTNEQALAAALKAAFDGVDFADLTTAWRAEMGPKPKK
jgi:hypothetical protein